MLTISSPLRPNQQSPAIANLIEALLFLLDRNLFAVDAALRAQLPNSLAEQRYTEAVKTTVSSVQAHFGLPATGNVNQQTAARINNLLQQLGVPLEGGDNSPAWTVSGRVFDRLGRAVEGVMVKVYDIDLRGIDTYMERESEGRQLLGESRSNADGFYTVPFAERAFQSAEAFPAQPDVVALVWDDNRVSSASRLAYGREFSAERKLESLDVVLEIETQKRRTEYELLQTALERPMRGLEPWQLSEKQTDFLQEEARVNAGQLRILIAADLLRHKQAEKPELELELLYGMARKEAPMDLSQLFCQSDDFLTEKIQAAIGENIIKAYQETPIRRFVSLLSRCAKTYFKHYRERFPLRTDLFYTFLNESDALSEADRQYIQGNLNRQLKTKVTEAIGYVEEPLRRAIAAAPLSYTTYTSLGLDAIVKEVLIPLLKRDRNLTASAVTLESRLANLPATPVGELLELDRMLKDHSAFREDVQRAKWFALMELQDLKDALFCHVIQNGQAVENWSSEDWDKLAETKLVPAKKFDRLLLAVGLSKLSNENFALVGALLNDQLERLSDLVPWEKHDWLNLLRTENIPIPDRLSVEDYADLLIYNLQLAFPSHYLRDRLIAKVPEKTLQSIHDVQDLLETNEILIAQGEVADLNWRGYSAAQMKKKQETLAALAQMANRYQYLGFAEIINDKTNNAQQKQALMQQRLGTLETFFQKNPGLDLRQANFFTKKGDDSLTSTGLKWGNMPAEDRRMVKQQLMAYQRVLGLTETVEAADALLKAGLDSSVRIAELGAEQLVAKTNISPREAFYIQNKAADRAAAVFHINTESSTYLQWDLAGMGTPIYRTRLINELVETEDFAVLFGSQNYCNCAHCRSVYSPAAYFVDLMYFIEEHVTKPNFKKAMLHSLKLNNRRIDLWYLSLTCENTHTLIPYLTIVNEVLESHIRSLNSWTEVYTKLAEQQISFSLPFVLPWEELRVYLGHFNLRLSDIYDLLSDSNSAKRRAFLNISQAEFDVIANANIAQIGDRYNVNISPKVYDQVPVFLATAGLTRKELDQLLRSVFNPDLGNIKIKRAPEWFSTEVRETLAGLTDARLDYIHRLVRLKRKLPWTLRELDYVLSQAKTAGLVTDLNGAAIELSADLHRLQEALSLSVEALCAAVFTVPVAGFSNQKTAMLERLFPGLVVPGSLSHPFFNINALKPETDPKVAVLFSGLGTREPELVTLLEYLRTEMAIDNDGKFELKLGGLSLLYRYFAVARGLKYSVSDLIKACRLALPAQKIERVADMLALVQFSTWHRRSSFSLDALLFMVGLQPLEHADAQATALLQQLQENKAGQFSVEQIYAIAPELRSDLADLIKQLESVVNWIDPIEPGSSIYRLNKNFGYSTTATTLSLTSSSDIKPEHLKALDAVLAPYLPLPVLRSHISRHLNISEAWFDALYALTGKPIEIAHDDFVAIIHTVPASIPAALLSKITDMLTGMQRWKTLFDATSAALPSVAFFIEHAALFSAALSLDFDLAKRFGFYQRLLRHNATASDAVYALLQESNEVNWEAPLATIWKKDASLVRSLIQAFPFVAATANVLDHIELLWRGLDLCRQLGINATGLPYFVSKDFADLSKARDLALGAIGAQYEDEKQRKEKLDALQEPVHEIKRDALTDYIIARQEELLFMDRDDLYKFLLLDVNMGGCFRISRVVAAISSLQLYIQRSMMHLERSTDGKVDVVVSQEAQEEWNEWRKNYRVWEANRKVFLYPENYIEPELRDDKTPEFEALEGELMQEKLTKEAATQAIKGYLDELSIISTLNVVSAFRDIDNNNHYLLGRSVENPYRYYYNTWENRRIWKDWRKIDLDIETGHASIYLINNKLSLFWTHPSYDCEVVDDKDPFFLLSFKYKIPIYYSFLINKKWQKPQLIDKDGLEILIDPILNVYIDKNNIDIEHWNAYDDKYKIEVVNDLAGVGFVSLFSYESNNVLKKDSIQLFKSKFFNIIENAPFYHISQIRKKFKILYCSLVKQILTESFEKANISKKIYPTALDGKLLLTHEFLLPTFFLTGRYKLSDFIKNFIDYEQVSMSVELDLRSGSWKAIFGNQNYISTADITTIKSFYQKKFLFDFNEDDFDNFEILIINKNSLSLSLGYWEPIIRISDQSFCFDSLESVNMYLDGYTAKKNRLYRLTSTLPYNYAKKLNGNKIDDLFDLNTQKTPEEWSVIPTINFKSITLPSDNSEGYNLNGPYTLYCRELFFHIPFLLANQCNAQGDYKQAKYWYEKIFNPFTSAKLDPVSPERDYWQFIEFRNNPDAILGILSYISDSAAIAAYRKDPFNPHAIARLRQTAYMKAIFMKYVDNLIDWADELFTQDSMESVNEAMMLYVMALDLLGKRPIDAGDCGEPKPNELTYNHIRQRYADGGDNFDWQQKIWETVYDIYEIQPKSQNNGTFILSSYQPQLISLLMSPTEQLKQDLTLKIHPFAEVKKKKEAQELTEKFDGNTNTVNFHSKGRSVLVDTQYIFCIPPNEKLLGYWDLLEDRLYKIRHCMNIEGVKRQIPLFQPPIDPMLLVRGKALGLSIEEILDSLNEALSPYRFTYLLEKVKGFAGLVQSFGGALLSALEKKDAEQLNMLRLSQEKEIQHLTRQIKRDALSEAKEQLKAVQEGKKNVENRIIHYEWLIQEGMSGWEVLQQVTQHGATLLQTGVATYHYAAAAIFALSLKPAEAKKEAGDAISSTFSALQSGASSAGLEASFQRREQDWNLQLTLAKQEYKQVEKQELAAEIRIAIAEKDLETFERNIEHTEELYEFHRDKFTNLGLYNYLSVNLGRLYRQAYNTVYELARVAERAYQFETDDQANFFLQPNNWTAERAGLMAAERLQLQLMLMEKHYLQNNTRKYEITQSFSLLQLAPDELVKLQETGKCDFSIPEFAFDLIYPGQYKRIIQGVRLSIPCISGPYTNVGCKLSLTNSKIRREPKTDESALVDSPYKGHSSIATSNGNFDSGMFEFNFRDERYLPFEGAGAVSGWSLALPKVIKSFDYHSIADVIIHISYTAKDDGAFKKVIEENILSILSSEKFFRLFSLRHDFPNAWYAWAKEEKDLEVNLEKHHFPYFMQVGNLQIIEIKAIEKGNTGFDAAIFTVTGDASSSWIVTGELSRDKEDWYLLVAYSL